MFLMNFELKKNMIVLDIKVQDVPKCICPFGDLHLEISFFKIFLKCLNFGGGGWSIFTSNVNMQMYLNHKYHVGIHIVLGTSCVCLYGSQNFMRSKYKQNDVWHYDFFFLIFQDFEHYKSCNSFIAPVCRCVYSLYAWYGGIVLLYRKCGLFFHVTKQKLLRDNSLVSSLFF